MIRQVARLRSDHSTIAHKVRTFEELDIGLRNYIHEDGPSIPIHKSSVQLKTARSILETAYEVQYLTQSFFETHTERVKALRPSHLPDPQFRFSDNPPSDYPEGRSYEPTRSDAPSWIEEQRVYRALWRIQLYYDFISYNTIDSGSANDVLRTLRKEGPHRVWSQLEPWELDEINCVYDCLNDVQALCGTPSDDAHETSKLPYVRHIEMPWAPQPVPQDSELDYLWSQCTEALRHPSLGYNFFHRYVRRMPKSPLQGSSFVPFRRLGFGIWDLKKMAALEMLNMPAKLDPPIYRKGYVPGVDKRLSSEDLLFTWASVANSVGGSEAR